MKVKSGIRLTVILCLLLKCLSAGCCAQTPDISARSAIVMDRLTGQVLYEKEADRQSLIASTTKIMTGLLVCEHCDLKQPVRIPDSACGIEGSSLYLKSGECCTVEELLYGMMLQSGNDAAAALAVTISGSEAAFLDLMNQKAAALGLTNTHFANPHGLDSGDNYSTARDLAVLTCAALNDPCFAQVVATEQITLNGRTMTNHNKLLRQYDGADGVKTGYTRAAGRILVSSATRDGRQLIAVTIHAPNDWQDHNALLDLGFSRLVTSEVLTPEMTLGSLPVAGDDASYVLLRPERSVRVNLLPEEQPRIRLLMPRFLYGPITDGQMVGTVEILINGNVIDSCGLIAARP